MLAFYLQLVRSFSLRMWLVIGVMLVLVFVVLVWIFSPSSRLSAPDGSVAFKDRVFTEVAGLNQVFAVNGSCMRWYAVELIGRAGGQQQYGLTFVLHGNPSDTTQLFKLLNDASCQSEQKAVFEEFSKRPQFAHTQLFVSYKTKSGQRFVL